MHALRIPNTGGLSQKSFFKYHTAIHDTIKGCLVPTFVSRLCPVLSQEFYRCLSFYGDQGEMDLMDFVRDAMFEAVVKQLFGKDNVPQTRVRLLIVFVYPFCAFILALYHFLVFGFITITTPNIH